ncbi:cilia- and flagella-associated protein 206 isoform X2 [Pogoniulus pusillus]|uniref:cilia- and flagella-associated protein 206 isoform X2 n=1 Tax=Pogoniulus pusillus TaxID=488313 RepID=UPI0030B94466
MIRSPDLDSFVCSAVCSKPPPPPPSKATCARIREYQPFRTRFYTHRDILEIGADIQRKQQEKEAAEMQESIAKMKAELWSQAEMHKEDAVEKALKEAAANHNAIVQGLKENLAKESEEEVRKAKAEMQQYMEDGWKREVEAAEQRMAHRLQRALTESAREHKQVVAEARKQEREAVLEEVARQHRKHLEQLKEESKLAEEVYHKSIEELNVEKRRELDVALSVSQIENQIETEKKLREAESLHLDEMGKVMAALQAAEEQVKTLRQKLEKMTNWKDSLEAEIEATRQAFQRMSADQAGSAINSIIRAVSRECAAQGQAVSEPLVVFLVRAVCLDPRNNFNVDQSLTERDVQNLIQLCVSRLLDTSNPSLSTMKMQVYFDLNYTDRAALQSVFPQTEMFTFVSLGKKKKEQQLQNLARLVTGIRLYNKELGKGGRSIDDLPAILNEAIPAATQTVEEALHTCHMLAYQYTALLESMQEDQHRYTQLSSFKLKEALFNVRQHEAFLCILLSDAVTSAQETEKKIVQFAATMEQLKSRVQNKVSINTKEVFPLFVELSDLWTSFQSEILLLNFLTNMTNDLQQFSEIQSQLFPEEVLTSLLEGVTVKTDEERRRETMGSRVNVSDFKNQEWLFPETTDNFDQLLIQYRGFCAHAIGVKGFTLPGNPAIGILRHREKCYVFSSKEAAYFFAQDPDKFIQLNVAKAQEYAELIQLLELHHQFEYLAPYAQARKANKSLMKPILKRDSSTQTDTHILPPTIVPSYEWNEWELRRKAVKLANLRRRLTQAMQTDVSQMRRDSCTQVYLPKDAGTQTKRDSSSNVPRPQVFLAGLRGGSSSTTQVVKVDLTRAVDET